MTTPEIRDARRSDLPRLNQLVTAAYEPFAGLLGLPDVTGGIAEHIAERTVLVAEYAGGVSGVVVADVAAPETHVINLAVDPDHGNHGIGAALIRAVEARARATGADRVALGSHAAFDGALRFYRSLGWTETGRDGVRVMMGRRL